METVWEKLHATSHNQGSRHTRILGNAFKILYISAIWSSLRRQACIFYQTRSHAVVLYNTLLAACSEKAVCMKTQEELYPKVRLRFVFQSNSQCGQQDLRSQDARSSWDSGWPPSRAINKYGVSGDYPFARECRSCVLVVSVQGWSGQYRERKRERE